MEAKIPDGDGNARLLRNVPIFSHPDYFHANRFPSCMKRATKPECRKMGGYPPPFLLSQGQIFPRCRFYHLAEFRGGDYVSETPGRATPLNMVTPAGILRKGDRIVLFPAREPPGASYP